VGVDVSAGMFEAAFEGIGHVATAIWKEGSMA
jgi:hypothetical protein